MPEAETTAEGGDDQLVGVWQTLNLKTGPVRSVDGFAKEFTVWPDQACDEKLERERGDK